MIEWIAEHKAVSSVLGVLFSGIGTSIIIHLFKRHKGRGKEENVSKENKSSSNSASSNVSQANISQTVIVNNTDSKNDNIIVTVPTKELCRGKKVVITISVHSSSP